MRDGEVKFSMNQIIIDEGNCLFDDFSSILSEDLEKEKISQDKVKEEILSIKKIKKEEYEKRFIGLYFAEGNKFPYPDTVIDSEKKLKEVKNPRKVNQIELNDQFFVLVDTNSSRIYISDQRRKSILEQWLREKLKKVVIIKPLIAQHDFIKQLNTIREVSFTIEPNLFNSGNNNVLSSELVKDIYGFGAEEATLKLRYKNKKRVSDKILSKLNLLLEQKNEYKNITIIGRTTENLESTFNINEVVNKIIIFIEPDLNTKKFDESKIFNALINSIKQYENKK